MREKYHESVMQRIERERYARLQEDKDKDRDRVGTLVLATIGVVIITVIILLTPRALDQWYYEQYELPMKEVHSSE